jgi:hypothetical protein
VSDISYDDAIRTIMRQQKVDYATAALLVGEVYPRLASLDEAVPEVAFDNPETVAVDGVYHPPVAEGRPIPVDDEPSPAWALAAQRARTEAEVEGNRYRSMSRRTSFHTVDD